MTFSEFSSRLERLLTSNSWWNDSFLRDTIKHHKELVFYIGRDSQYAHNLEKIRGRSKEELYQFLYDVNIEGKIIDASGQTLEVGDHVITKFSAIGVIERFTRGNNVILKLKGSNRIVTRKMEALVKIPSDIW